MPRNLRRCKYESRKHSEKRVSWKMEGLEVFVDVSAEHTFSWG